MATITKYEGKGKISWNVRVRKGGKLHTATFPTKKMAENWSRDLENQIVQDKYFPSAQKSTHTVGELINLYCSRILPQKAPRTQREQGKILAWWKANLGDTSIKNVTTPLLEEYKDLLSTQKKFANGTTNLYLNTLSPCFSWASSPRLGWLSSNPFQHIKRLKEEPRRPLVTDEQLQTLLWSCGQSQSPYLYLFVRLVLGTGGRNQEIMTLKWNQVNFRRQTVTFIKTKGKEDRVVPLDKATLQLLDEHHKKMFPEGIWETRDEANTPLFMSTMRPGQTLKTVFKAYSKARQRAGLPWLRIHDCRHVYATRLAEKGGADLATLAELLGHKNLKHTQRYRHVTQKHNAAIIEKMAQATFHRDFDIEARRKR